MSGRVAEGTDVQARCMPRSVAIRERIEWWATHGEAVARRADGVGCTVLQRVKEV